MLPRALLAAALLLAASPGAAQARVFVTDDPGDLSVLHPLDDESLAALLHGEVVRHWWSNGSHATLAPLGPFTRHAVSPDGAWIVRRHLEEDPRTGAFNDTVRAVRVADGNETILRAGELRGLATGGGLVAVTTAGNESAWAWRWGEWDRPVALWANLSAEAEARRPAPGAGEAPLTLRYAGPPFDASRAYGLAMSPDGGWLAVEADRRIWTFNLTTGRPLSPWPAAVEDRVVGLAFSPDAARLAVLTSQTGRFSELHVLRRAGEGLEAQETRPYAEEGLGLAWGEAGVALVQATREGAYGPQTGVVVRAYPPDGALGDERRWERPGARAPGGIAFAGARLVVAVDGALWFFAEGATPVLTSRPGEPPVFHDAPSTDGADAGDAGPEPPATRAPSQGAPSRDAPLPWWIPLGALAALSAARTPSHRRR